MQYCYRGCGTAGKPPLAAKDGCPPPDREAELRRIFRFYEQALHRNTPASAAAESLADLVEAMPSEVGEAELLMPIYPDPPVFRLRTTRSCLAFATV